MSTPLFSDSFNRANGNLNDGVLWDKYSGGDAQITNNAADLLTTVGPTASTVHGLVAKDVGVSANLTLGPNCSVGLVLRADANNKYNIDFWRHPDEGTVKVGFYKTLAGNDGNFIPGTTAIGAYADGFAVRVKAIGDTFLIYRDGAQVLAVYDAASPILTAGRFGLRNGNGGAGSRFVDNYAVTDETVTSSGAAALTQADYDGIAAAIFARSIDGGISMAKVQALMLAKEAGRFSVSTSNGVATVTYYYQDDVTPIVALPVTLGAGGVPVGRAKGAIS